MQTCATSAPLSNGFRKRICAVNSVVKRLTPAEVGQAFDFLQPVRGFYPDFETWFTTKVYPGCLRGTRAVFACVPRSGREIRGVVVAKRDASECKICTIFVHPSPNFHTLDFAQPGNPRKTSGVLCLSRIVVLNGEFIRSPTRP